MEKNFDNWSLLKKNLESNSNHRNFEERDVWWCHLGINLGYEQNGKDNKYSRPVLVLRKFNVYTFLGIPLTTTNKDHPLYYPTTIGGREGSLILSQIKLYSVKRLSGARAIERVPELVFEEIRMKVREMI